MEYAREQIVHSEEVDNVLYEIQLDEYKAGKAYTLHVNNTHFSGWEWETEAEACGVMDLIQEVNKVIKEK